MGKKPVADICGWVALAGDYKKYPSLCGEEATDWAIIGGGFTGLSAARRIAELQPEARIFLIEGKRIGQGATGRNSGFIVANESPGHAALSTANDRADYGALNMLDHAGIAELKRLVKQHNINCQWEDTGSIHAAASAENFDKIRRHAETFQKMDIDSTLMEEDALRTRLGTSFYKLGILSRGGALVQPAALAKGLAEALPERVEIFENAPVLDVKGQGDHVAISLKEGKVRAAKVIIGVNAFLPRLRLYKTRVFPLALTASLTRVLTDKEEKAISHARSWGILSPQSLGATMRLTRDRRILIRNTAEYRPGGITPALLAQRRDIHIEGLKKRFPWLPASAIEYTWSGNICISRNSKPVFEKLSENLYVAGCYNASGVSRGTIFGRLIADLATGQPSTLLDKALSLQKPKLIPPRPIIDIGVKAKMALERTRARDEI